MCSFRKAIGLAALSLGMAGVIYGQSLGDVAREQRQKQQAKQTPAAPKVITNDDIPEQPDSSPSNSPQVADSASPHGTKSAEQWKAEILAQKKSIAALQSQIDRLSSTVHFVEANRYWNGVQHNERQVQKQDQVARMQAQLDGQKKKLEDMQESARRDGYGNAVYDP